MLYSTKKIILLGDINERLPFIVLGGSALLGGIFALLNLPETLGKKLPETMEEALDLGRKNGRRKKRGNRTVTETE